MSVNSIEYLVGTQFDEEDSSSQQQCGEIHLYDSINLSKVLDGNDQPDDSIFSESTPTDLLCLVYVPSYMIPAEILQYFSADLECISSFKILRHRCDQRKYMALLRTISVDAAAKLCADYNSQILSSIDQSICTLVPVRSISTVKGDVNDVVPGSQETDSESQYCPLCLDIIPSAQPMSFTTSCCHTFHIKCAIKLESLQCPVCR